MSQNIGVIISQTGQMRKELLNEIQFNEVDNLNDDIKLLKHDNFQLLKVKACDEGETFQEQLNPLVELEIPIKQIYYTMRFERLDVMKSKVKAILKYFKEYINQFSLIITQFEKSKRQEQDFEVIKKQMEEYGLIFIYGYTKEQGISNGQYQYESVNQFFLMTLSNQNQLYLDSFKLTLKTQIDLNLNEQLKNHIKRQQKQNKRSYSTRPKLQTDQNINRLKSPPQRKIDFTIHDDFQIIRSQWQQTTYCYSSKQNNQNNTFDQNHENYYGYYLKPKKQFETNINYQWKYR